MARSILVCITAFALLNAAAASAAECPPGTPLAYGIKAPETVAFGRTFRAEFAPEYAEGWDMTEMTPGGTLTLTHPAQISFAALDPSHPLGDEFSASITEYSASSPKLFFSHGEKAGVLSARWTQTYTDYLIRSHPKTECEATRTQIVKPERGKLVKPWPTITGYARPAGDTAFRLLFPCPERTNRTGDNPINSSSAPVVVRLQGSGKSRTVRLPDPCEYFVRTTRKTPKWEAEAGPSLKSTSQLTVEPGLNVGKHPSHVEFAVRQAGVLLMKGRFKLRMIFKPSKVIFEGTDAFINDCIDHSRTLHSHHHRLYCVDPGVLRYETFGLRYQRK